MRNLSTLNESPREWYKSVASAKRGNNKTLLNQMEGRVYTQYDNYYNNRFNLERLEPISLSEVEKEALIHSYDGETMKLEELKFIIKENQSKDYGATCQYCGINTPNTFDHYIPKEIFPELSTLHYNLIPCCSECNSNKGRKWLNSNNKRRFLQLYFDSLPKDEKYLFSSISFIEDIPIVSYFINNNDGINQDLFNIIDSHFFELKLKFRYLYKSNEIISELERSLRSINNRVNDFDIDAEIKTQINNLRDQYGINYWKASLLEGVLSCEELINKFSN